MTDVFEAKEELIKTIESLVVKVKSLKDENKGLKKQIDDLNTLNQQSANAVILTEGQKVQIEKLLQETKEVLLED